MDAGSGGAQRIVLRPVASPLALGFVGLAVDSLLVSGLELGWFPASERHQAALLILLFAPLLQLVASVFGFLARDAVAATGLAVLAATWLGIGAVTITTPAGSHTVALGMFLVAAGAGALVSAAVAARTKRLVAVVMGATAVRFLLTGMFDISGVPGWRHGAGVLGVVVTALALYGALAIELEEARGATLLPTCRRGSGRRALDGGLAEQTDGVAREPGVREEL